MEPTSIAEQRATAVAMLKRAASLPRMKDGRRPPMHVEAVSEGERAENDLQDEESAPDSDEKPDASPGHLGMAGRGKLEIEMDVTEVNHRM